MSAMRLQGVLQCLRDAILPVMVDRGLVVEQAPPWRCLTWFGDLYTALYRIPLTLQPSQVAMATSDPGVALRCSNTPFGLDVWPYASGIRRNSSSDEGFVLAPDEVWQKAPG